MAYMMNRMSLVDGFNGFDGGMGRTVKESVRPVGGAHRRRAADEYRGVGVETRVEGASPYKMVLMLLEGVLSRIATAKVCIEQRQISCKGEKIGQAITILAGLRASLDMDEGGSLSQDLDGLYLYCEHQLLQANLSNNIELLDKVSAHLSEIFEAWKLIPDTFHQASLAQVRNQSVEDESAAPVAAAM